MSKLIDRVLNDVHLAEMGGNKVRYIEISEPKYEELKSDFADEFEREYEALGMAPDVADLKEFLPVPIKLVDNGEQEYKVVT